MIIIPGGFGTRELINDENFINWLKTAKNSSIKVSVCSGSLLMGAAGFLQGKSATTHPSAFSEVEKYCKSVIDMRIVDEGEVITARGVTSSIDLGLYLCEKIASYDIKEKIRKQMDY
jgi:cyclohexyl-isocyanide hydratase